MMSDPESAGGSHNFDKNRSETGGNQVLETNNFRPSQDERNLNSIKPVCRFFNNDFHCRYGNHCRFSHCKPETSANGSSAVRKDSGYQQNYEERRNLKKGGDSWRNETSDKEFQAGSLKPVEQVKKQFNTPLHGNQNNFSAGRGFKPNVQEERRTLGKVSDSQGNLTSDKEFQIQSESPKPVEQARKQFNSTPLVTSLDAIKACHTLHGNQNNFSAGRGFAPNVHKVKRNLSKDSDSRRNVTSDKEFQIQAESPKPVEQERKQFNTPLHANQNNFSAGRRFTPNVHEERRNLTSDKEFQFSAESSKPVEQMRKQLNTPIHTNQNNSSAGRGFKPNVRYFYRSRNENTTESPPESRPQPARTCRYFLRGNCNFGDDCRFLHQRQDENFGEGIVLKSEKDAKREKLQFGKQGSKTAPYQSRQHSRNAQFDESAPISKNRHQAAQPQAKSWNLEFYEGYDNRKQTARTKPKYNDANTKSDQSSGVFEKVKPAAKPQTILHDVNKEYNDKSETNAAIKITDELHVQNSNSLPPATYKMKDNFDEAVNFSDESPVAQISSKLIQNRSSMPVGRSAVKLQDLNENEKEKLRNTEIEQLKKRFPDHKLIDSEEIFHVAFSPSDPDWAFAVNTVTLEICFSKDYPLKPCVIKVKEDDNLPTLLVWYLNTYIRDWIQDKHSKCEESGTVELIFRPFLHWLDRNLEELFINGLRKVKQDILAKESGIEYVPYDKLPGAVGAEVSPKSECWGDIVSAEMSDSSSDYENSNCAQNEGGNHIVDERAESSSTNEENENVSPDLQSVERSATSLVLKDSGIGKFSIPKSGTEVKLLGLELKESVAAMFCVKISVTLQCSRCKARHEISTPPNRNNTLNCIKCHQSMQMLFQPALLHEFSAVLGYLHLNDCLAVDLPLMECNFTVDCLNCSKQICVCGVHYGQQLVTWCMFCNQKMSIYAQTVKFHQLQPSLIVSTGNKFVIPTKKDKRIIKDPAVQEGKPLPDCGICKHYKKSYRWLRFPCCGKTYPCDICHNEKEIDHEMKYASRMICGFCAKEQPYAGDKPCVSCSANMTKKSGSHWEGGRGCRDKITMCREDRQKYAGLGKTISRKSQSLKPTKK